MEYRRKRHYPARISSLGDLIRAARLDVQKTQSWLARQMNIKQSTVSLWEVRGVIPKARHLAQVSALLRLPPGEVDRLSRPDRRP
ncbi:MAG: helix-turn-helix transcriptional regulator [Tepidisphaeraceae bacterium]